MLPVSLDCPFISASLFSPTFMKVKYVTWLPFLYDLLNPSEIYSANERYERLQDTKCFQESLKDVLLKKKELRLNVRKDRA